MPAIHSDSLDLDPNHASRRLVNHHDLSRLEVGKRAVKGEVVPLSEPANDLHLPAESHRARDPATLTQRARRNDGTRLHPGDERLGQPLAREHVPSPSTAAPGLQ